MSESKGDKEDERLLSDPRDPRAEHSSENTKMGTGHETDGSSQASPESKS